MGLVLNDPLAGACHLVRGNAQILRVPNSFSPLDCLWSEYVAAWTYE